MCCTYLKIYPNKLSKYKGLLEEADCVEDCSEWMRMPLMGYSAKELREAVEKLK